MFACGGLAATYNPFRFCQARLSDGVPRFVPRKKPTPRPPGTPAPMEPSPNFLGDNSRVVRFPAPRSCPSSPGDPSDTSGAFPWRPRCLPPAARHDNDLEGIGGIRRASWGRGDGSRRDRDRREAAGDGGARDVVALRCLRPLSPCVDKQAGDTDTEKDEGGGFGTGANAKPSGSFRPLANVDLTPLAVNLLML